jgi:uncharacterized membrane protein (DUF2068 family)
LSVPAGRLAVIDPDRAAKAEAGRPLAKRRTLRTIAVFEAIKGLAALAAIVGVLELMHRDVRHLALELIGHFGLNPDARYPEMVLHYADLLPGANLRALVALAVGYTFVRLLEAYGLWHDRAWGEWLGALSGGLYIPFELTHMMHRPSLVNAAVLAGNIFVVGFLAFQLWRRPRKHAAFG